MAEHLGFGFQHAVAVAEVLKVTAADDRQHTDGGLRHLGETRHLAKAGNTHFDHGGFGVLGHAQQRQRHAQLVVEVALGFVGLVFLRKHRIEHFLGGGLAHAARYAHYGNIEFFAVRPADLLDSRQCGRHQNVGLGGVFGRLFADGANGAAVKAGFDKIVSVNALARNGKEQRAVLDAAAVALDRGDAGAFQ